MRPGARCISLPYALHSHRSSGLAVSGLRTGVVFLIIILTLLLHTMAASAAPNIPQAMESVVIIDIVLSSPGHEPVEVQGSGWTRQCTLHGKHYSVTVATAAHVIDLEDIALEADLPRPIQAHITVRYYDGLVFAVPIDNLQLDRMHDYGELRFTSANARTVLASGQPSQLTPGERLTAIASPAGIPFGVFDGLLIIKSPGSLAGTPPGSWLSTMPVGPGASGGPVMAEDGTVVATVVGWARWAWGGEVSLLVALPEAPFTTPMHTAAALFDSTLPPTIAGLLAALGTAAIFLGLPFLNKRRGISMMALQLLQMVCEKVVMALEQSHPDLPGPEKKRRAEELVGQMLSHLHINVPRVFIESGIEAAVLLMNALTYRRGTP